jgi:uncharacterized membrane protein YphA (DoxX/SURF4 family)
MLPTTQEQVIRVLGDEAGAAPEGAFAGDTEAPPPPPRPASWSWLHLLGFRFALLYVVLYVLPFPVTLLQSPHVPKRLNDRVTELLERYSQGSLAAVKFFGESVLRGDPVTVQRTGSGDTRHNYLRVGLVATLAGIGALAWSVLFRRGRHPLLLGSLVLLLRFYLGQMFLSYGFAKLFPNQMSFPTWDRLMAPYGQASPMSVLWTFIGSSPAFEIFTGAAEMLAGLLLFFRHTATLGALIGISVMTNIVMMNLCYDVPVKLPSLNYLAMLGILLAPDLSRLVRVFVLHAPVEAKTLWTPLRWRLERWLMILVKLVVLVEILWVQVDRNYDRWSRKTLTSPLIGAWEVTEVVRDGASAPLLVNDTTLFRRVMIDAALRPPPETGELLVAAIQYMDETRLVRLEVDEKAGTLLPPSRPQSQIRAGSRPGGSQPAPGNRAAGTRPQGDGGPLTASRASGPTASRPRLELTFKTPEPDVLVLEGNVDGVPSRATFRRVDPKTIPLVSKGFSWIQELPVNRYRIPPQAR